MKKITAEKINKKEVERILKTEASKSLKMKQLFDGGLEIKEIAELMQVRYNFVYNVISNYVNINEIAVEKAEKETKKSKILELKKAGKTNMQIAKELKINYNYVHKVIKENQQEKEEKEA